MRSIPNVIKLSNIELISEYIGGGRMLPRFYGFLGGNDIPLAVIASLNSYEKLVKESNVAFAVPRSIPLYYIRDIKYISKGVAHISVSPAYSGFDKSNQPDKLQGNVSNTSFEFEIPVSVLLTMRALFKIDENVFLKVDGGSYAGGVFSSKGKTGTSISGAPLMTISYPPSRMSSTWKILSDSLLSISRDGYADPEDAYSTGVSSSLRNVQRTLLRLLTAMTNGDAKAMVKIMDSAVEPAYTVDTKGRYAARGKHADTAEQLREMVKYIYVSSLPNMSDDEDGDVSNYAGNPVEVTGNGAETIENLDERFEALMSFNDMSAPLVEVERDEPTYLPSKREWHKLLDPLAYGIPVRMIDITEWFAHNDVDVLEMARWDFNRPAVIEYALDTYGEYKCAKAIILVAALRVATFAEQNSDEKKSLILTKFLSLPNDGYPWELSTFNEPLARYDISGFENMINFNIAPDRGYEGCLYLIPASAEIIKRLVEDGWTLTNMNTRLNMSPKAPELPKVRSLFACILDNDVEIHAEELPAIIMKSIHRIFGTYDTAFISKSIAASIPVLADYYASVNDTVAGSKEWNNVRNTFVDEVMNNVSNNLIRKM